MNNKKIIRESVLTAVAMFIFISVIFLCAGIYENGGVHEVDHQYFITVKNEIKDFGYWKTLLDVCKNYMQFRFNILYPIEVVTSINFFADNWALYYFIRTVTFSICCSVLFCIARLQDVSFFYSISFVFLNLVGYQFALFSDLCAIGASPMLLFSVCVLLAIIAAKNDRKIYRILFILSFIIGILCGREIYVIVYPCIVLIYFQLKNEIYTFKTLIKSNLDIIVTAFASYVFCACFILSKLKMGINGSVLAGGVASSFFDIVINSAQSMIWLGYIFFMLILSVSMMGVHLFYSKGTIIKKNKLQLILCAIWVTVFILLEMIICSKRGIQVQYRIPFMFPIAWVLCIQFYNMFKADREIISVYSILMIFIISAIVINANVTVREECYGSKSFKNIINWIDNNMDKDANLLIAVGGIENDDDFGHSISYQMFLEDIGYAKGYIFREGICEDMYNGSIKFEKTNRIEVNSNIAFDYNFFNYYVNNVDYIDVKDADVILIGEHDRDRFLTYLENQDLLNEYQKKDFFDSEVIVFYRE